MVLVTAWSLWAWAQPAKPAHGSPHHRGGNPGGAPPAAHPGAKGAPEGADAKEEPEEEETGPAPMNWSEFDKETPPFVAMLINFGILAAGYYLLGKKPIAAGLHARRDAIAKEIEEAQRMRAEAEQRAKIYQAKLETLEDEVRMAREALVRSGEAERDRIVAEAEANAERMRNDTQFVVEQELKQMRQDLC